MKRLFKTLFAGGLVALALFGFGIPETSQALEFELIVRTLRAAGNIEPGDARKLSVFIQGLPRDELDDLNVTLSLDSPGGNLFEGMRLGEAIRSAKIATIVENGHGCHSACAIAFLGGTISGATKDGAKRQIEPGALLGYHGFYSNTDTLKLENESLDEARTVNAIILEYAYRMGGIDLGFLARLLNTTPSEVTLVRTPEALDALGIELIGSLPKLPKDWPFHACTNSIRGMLDSLDPLGLDARVDRVPIPMANVADFRSKLLEDKFPTDNGNLQIRAAISKLSPPQGIDLLSGQAMYADQPGKRAVYRVSLRRGAGFYFDGCYAITDFNGIDTIVVDGVSHSAIVRHRNMLTGFPPRDPLW